MDVFWKSILSRVVRTVLVTFVSWLTLAGGLAEVDYLAAASASALAGVLSLLTNLLNGLPETDTKTLPKWQALGLRVLYSFVQSFVAFIPAAAVFLTDVDWVSGLNIAGGAALGSLLLGLVSVLPESNPNDSTDAWKQVW